MLPDPKQFPNAHVRVQDEPCARLLCEVQFFVEGRWPSGRLIRHITPLSTTYFADDQPTEFLVVTAFDWLSSTWFSQSGGPQHGPLFGPIHFRPSESW